MSLSKFTRIGFDSVSVTTPYSTRYMEPTLAFQLTRLAAALNLFAIASLSQAEPIQNQYIVVLKDTATLTQILDLPVGTPVKNLLDQAQAQLGLPNQQINFRYQSVFKGVFGQPAQPCCSRLEPKWLGGIC